MNKILLSLSVATVFMFGACSKSDDNPPPVTPMAKVMFVNATRTADTVRAEVNDTAVVGATALPYVGNTPYITFSTGSKMIAFIYKDGAPLTDTTVNLAGNVAYSAFSTGILQDPGILVTVDDLATPAAGHAKVRFINLSTDVDAYNAYVGSSDSASLNGNTNFRGVGSFKQYPAGTHDIVVERIKIGGPPDVETKPAFTLTAGKIYTVILTGNMGLSGTSARKVTVIANN
jgi:hypothetical protein